jgi:phosphate-selective porin OprO and OprP
MSRTKSLWLIAGAALSMGAAALAQNSLDQSRAYTNELMADAAGRTSALAQGTRNFTVDVHGFTQFRYIWTERDEGFGEEDDTALGFQAARTRLSVSGNIIDENWGYFIQFGFDAPEEGTATLLDAYGTYRMENGWNLMFGQFKLPFLREELVSEKHQLAWDRSAMNYAFTLDRGQGIQFGFEGDQVRFMAAFSDGANTDNTDYTSGAEADFGITGRLEFKWAGDWRQFRDFTSFQNSDFAGMVGVAGHYQSGGDTLNTMDVQAWALTADVSVEGNGWNVFAAGVYTNVDPDVGDDTNNWAWLIQGGFFVSPQLEIFARFDMLIPDDDFEDADEFSALTAGINYYLVPESHAAKFTAGFIYLFDDPGNAAAVTPGGGANNTLVPILADQGDGQFSIVGQFQLVF